MPTTQEQISELLTELGTSITALNTLAATINGISAAVLPVSTQISSRLSALESGAGNIATSESNGVMSKEDKAKLDGIANNANNYVHPTSAGNKHIPSGGSESQILVYSSNGTAAWASTIDCGEIE